MELDLDRKRPEELIQPSGLLPCTINVKVSLLQTHPTGVCTKLSKLHSSTPNHSFQRTLSRQTRQCCICKEHIFICCESGPSREFRDNCGCWHTNTGKESGTKYPWLQPTSSEKSPIIAQALKPFLKTWSALEMWLYVFRFCWHFLRHINHTGKGTAHLPRQWHCPPPQPAWAGAPATVSAWVTLKWNHSSDPTN